MAIDIDAVGISHNDILGYFNIIRFKIDSLFGRGTVPGDCESTHE